MVGLILGTGSNGADLSMVTADASDIAKGKVIVGSNGQPITGTLDTYNVGIITPNTGAQTINGPVIIPNSLTVMPILTQSRTVYPSSVNQVVRPDTGKYFDSVTVKRIVRRKILKQSTSYVTVDLSFPESSEINQLIYLSFHGQSDATSYSTYYRWVVSGHSDILCPSINSSSSVSVYVREIDGSFQPASSSSAQMNIGDNFHDISLSLGSQLRVLSYYFITYIYV